MVNTNQECYSDQNDDLPLSITKHIEDSNLVDAMCQTGHNAHTCNSDNANDSLALEHNHKNYVENLNSMSTADKDSINNKLIIVVLVNEQVIILIIVTLKSSL
ncbi:hypothetical protein F8M41_012532 [Gigaspora margarita]|uniref:Uncharacterized protein n=1 Tax=Gigaspora margarita TaxID=4874 RepID=A0A8H4EPM5_GIGMA|nr:hypothetical protein F8M41_012532 [Gigaspora margarita]